MGINKKKDKSNIVQNEEYKPGVGEKVVHNPEGVCIIEKIEKIETADHQKKDYYKLVPVMDKTCAVYIPLSSVSRNIRKLRSKEEILAILEKQKNAKPLWEKNEQKRIVKRRKAIQEDDGTTIAILIKNYRHKMSKGHINIADSNWLKKAEQFFYSEVAEVLGEEFETVCTKDVVNSDKGDE